MIKIEKTHINDLLLIKPPTIYDERGYFFEAYNKEMLLKLNFNINFIQDNESESKYGVLRGIHFQKKPYEQSKLVRVIKGEIQDVAIDLRPSSETYKEYFSIILNDTNKYQLFIPQGFGHAFLTLSKEAIVSYKIDSGYNSIYESGIRYNDPQINIKWALDDNEIILSDKDRNLPAL